MPRALRRLFLVSILIAAAAVPAAAQEAAPVADQSAAEAAPSARIVPPPDAVAMPFIPPESIINAWKLSIADAAALAELALKDHVADLQVDPVRQTLRFTQSVANGAFILGQVEPRLVQSGLDKTRGVIFDIRILGASGVVEQAQKAHAHALRRRIEETARLKNVRVNAIVWPETLPDRSEIAVAEATVPREREPFEKFIRRRKPDPVEGVWERTDGKVRVGVYRELLAPGRVYSAMVLDAPDDSVWETGEIKFELEMLEENLGSGPLYRDDRARAETVWRFEEGHLVALNAQPGGHVVRYDRVGPSINFDKEPLHNGTGWVVSDRGHVVTNYHVVEDATEIRVGFREGPWRPATVLLSDERMDIAVLKVEDPAVLGPALKLRAGALYPDGADATAVGFPLAQRLGEQLKVTAGVVSGQTGDKGDLTRIQHTAALQPGSSGGPLVDRHGNVAAVAVSLLRGNQVQDVNFAIKIGYLKLLLDGFGVPYQIGGSERDLSSELIADEVRGSVLPIWVDRPDD
ncbi:MAG: S1C family serine protease [Minwuia sp.]|uniref:S1C family serine protease n=1 Tax=Minwuia sp. TaxID=2493630 RepID=UPI003A84ED7F